MNRRRFLYRVTIGLAVPCVADAQQAAKLSRIGFLSLNKTRNLHLHEAFRQGMRDLGYVEGRNLVIEYRDAEGSSTGSPLLRPNWLRSRLMSSWPQPHLKSWPPNKRPRPSPSSSLLLPIRLGAGSSPALRGRVAMPRGLPTSARTSSASVWNCSGRPCRGSVGSLPSGRQVPTTDTRKRRC